MSKGLTLIEIAVGIAIISFGVIFIISAFPLGVMISNSNEKSNISLFLASTKIEEIISQIYDETDEGVLTEDFGEILEFPQYKRILEVECFNPNLETGDCSLGEDFGIKKITVVVSHKLLTKRNVTLTTLFVKK